MSFLLSALKRQIRSAVHRLGPRLLEWTRPTRHSLSAGLLTDLTRTKPELLAENALLRKPLLILRRPVKRPTYSRTDRMLLVVLARATRHWKQALLIVQPNTLLGWHRQLFRWFWRQRSKVASRTPKIAAETLTLIPTMARDNRFWGAERIQGELRETRAFTSPNVRFKSTCASRALVLPPRPGAPSCTTMRARVSACDFLPVTDLFFRSLFAFFLSELKTRRVMHVGVTRHPTDAWVSQQLREATPYGQAPKYLISDHDSKFGPLFARVASGTGIKLLRTPFHAPRANARLSSGSWARVRRECLDHVLIFHEQQLSRVLQAYVVSFNQARPHQGLQQQIPDPPAALSPATARDGPILARPILGGLHHDYRRVA